MVEHLGMNNRGEQLSNLSLMGPVGRGICYNTESCKARLLVQHVTNRKEIHPRPIHDLEGRDPGEWMPKTFPLPCSDRLLVPPTDWTQPEIRQQGSKYWVRLPGHRKDWGHRNDRAGN